MDLLGSSFSEFLIQAGVERNLFKLFNLQSMLVKKTLSEHRLFDFADNKAFFTKTLLSQEKIVDEEFLAQGEAD